MTFPARRAVFALVTLAAVFALAEAGARAYGSLARAASREGSASGQGGLRIVCVGDSWVNGYGVGPGESWPAQLAGAVAQAGGPAVTVENLGASGSSAVDAAQTLARRVATGVPIDLVIALTGMNPGREFEVKSEGGGALRALRPYLSRSALYRLLTQVVWRLELQADAVLSGEDKGQARYMVGGLVESREAAAQHERQELARMAADVARIDALAAVGGGELLLLNYAFPPSLLNDPSFAGAVANRRLHAAAATNAVPLLDVQAEYVRLGVVGPEVVIHGAEGLRPARPGGRQGPEGDARAGGYELHPNAKGHAIYANTIARYLAN